MYIRPPGHELDIKRHITHTQGQQPIIEFSGTCSCGDWSSERIVPSTGLLHGLHGSHIEEIIIKRAAGAGKEL